MPVRLRDRRRNWDGQLTGRQLTGRSLTGPELLERFDHTTAGEMDDPIGDSAGTIVLVGGEHDGAAGRSGPRKKLVEKIAAVVIQPGMRFVEQPEASAARDQHSQTGAALLSGGAAAHGRGRQPAREAQLLEGRADPRDGASCRSNRKPQVLLYRQLLVQERLMSEHPDLAPHRAPISHEVPAEHRGLARMHLQQAGENLENAGLACAVRTAQVHYLALGNFERSSCKEGEAAGERYGLVETNGRRHGDLDHAMGQRVSRAKREAGPGVRHRFGRRACEAPAAAPAGSGAVAAESVEVGVDHHLD